MGPTGVALVTPKPWVVGMLARQLWSVAGPSDRSNVSQLLLQTNIRTALSRELAQIPGARLNEVTLMPQQGKTTVLAVVHSP